MGCTASDDGGGPADGAPAPGGTAIDGAATGGGEPLPLGGGPGWVLMFGDEFDGDAVDWSRWADTSSAEADEGRGNPDNQQLEWNQAGNCSLSGGVLTITARREAITSQSSGRVYDWTSCLLSSDPSYLFQYGFIETRAQFPPQSGFWPGFWTWQAPGVDVWTETDVYEYYSDNPGRLYQTAHGSTSDGCDVDLDFDPSADFHVYGAEIAPTGTTYYIDGVASCSVAVSHRERVAIVDNMFVYSQIPPDPATDSADKSVDYIRAWQR